MDHHIGTLRKSLASVGHAEDTAILYHADHGWQLGEHAMWRKMSCFELATRIPFILHVPCKSSTFILQLCCGLPGMTVFDRLLVMTGMKETAGTRSKQLIEMVDVLPTLVELGGLTLPTNETYDGVSLVPIVSGKATSTGKNMSFS